MSAPRVRAEDRIRAARSTGLRNLPCTTRPRARSGWRSSRSPSTGSKLCPTLADQQHPIPATSTITTGAVEPGAHPARQPDHQPCPQAEIFTLNEQRDRQQADDPSCKIEANDTPSTASV